MQKNHERSLFANNKYTHIPSLISDEEIGMLRMYAYELIPDWVRVMPEKRKASFYVPKEKAMDSPWIQLHKNDRHWVMVDFDTQDEHAWKRLPIPPNCISVNTDNGNQQCYFLLNNAVHCHTKAKRSKPYKLLKAIERAIDVQFGGDSSFRRVISKNPFHPRWDTVWIHNKRHTLEELVDGLNLELGKQKTKDTTVTKQAVISKSDGGRNVSMFDRVRLKCYREVARYKALDNIDYDDWFDTVLKWCMNANNFQDVSPLDSKEVMQIAKSIAHWCWYIYTPRKVKKKRMSEEEVKQAKSNAAKITNAKRKGSSEAAINAAIKQLQGAGKKPTKAAVARIVGLSRESVSKYYSHLFS